MPLLRLSSVAKSYRRGHAAIDVLRDVSLTVTEGSLVSVYGGRGSGKTTLLRIAAGFESPDAGEVFLADRRPSHGVGWVQSDGPHMSRIPTGAYLALTLYRDLGPRSARARAREALAAIGAEQYADECWDDLPNVGRALCAIAHATIRRPRLLVADDPTAGLSTLDRERVCTVLRTAAEDDGFGVLITVPDLSSTLRSHETRFLSRGRLFAAPDGGDAEVVDLATRRSA